MTRKTTERDQDADALVGLEFNMPTEEKWKELVKSQKLSPEQRQALWVCLQHVDDDLRQYVAFRRSLPPRSDGVAKLKRIEAALGRVCYELDRAGTDLLPFLPLDVGSFIGRSMSFAAIGEVTGKDEFPVFVDNAMSVSLTDGRPMTQKDIEHDGKPRREALGMLHGDKLLRYLIAGIHGPLARWVELDRQNKGGRSPDLRRGFIIYWLAYEAEDIIRRKASNAITGPFVRLCVSVFEACCLPTIGLEKAIPKIVVQARKDRLRNTDLTANTTDRRNVLTRIPE